MKNDTENVVLRTINVKFVEKIIKNINSVKTVSDKCFVIDSTTQYNSSCPIEKDSR